MYFYRQLFYVKSILGTGLFTGFSYMNRLLFISQSFSIDPLHLCIGSSFHFLEIGLITHSHELVDKIFQIVLLPVYVHCHSRCRLPTLHSIRPDNTMSLFQGLPCKAEYLYSKARLAQVPCMSQVRMHCVQLAQHPAQGCPCRCHHPQWRHQIPLHLVERD